MAEDWPMFHLALVGASWPVGHSRLTGRQELKPGSNCSLCPQSSSPQETTVHHTTWEGFSMRNRGSWEQSQGQQLLFQPCPGLQMPTPASALRNKGNLSLRTIL